MQIGRQSSSSQNENNHHNERNCISKDAGRIKKKF